MSGTKEGGVKAAKTNKERQGDDFYKRIGATGGKNGTGMKGFACNPQLASEAGRKGGKKSKRTKTAFTTVTTAKMTATVSSNSSLDDAMTTATSHKPSIISKFLGRA